MLQTIPFWALIIYGLIRVIQPVLTMPDELADPAELGRLEQGDAIDEPLPVPPEFVANPPQWFVFEVIYSPVNLNRSTINSST